MTPEREPRSTRDHDKWPPVAYETRDWVPSGGFGIRSALQSYATVPFQAAVPVLIGERTPMPEADVAADAEEAARELTRFDAELGARVSAFAPVLLRSEAASSSQIENLTSSARAIFSAELGAKVGRNAQEIVANTKALRAALDLSDDISVTAIAEMHRTLMASQPRHTPGEYRNEQVWIGRRGDSPVGAEFVPPHHSRVADLVVDLCAFAARWDVPAVIATAVAHAQFETIHPYTDGNGRTGRALAQSMLRHRGVTRNVAVPVSAGLLADVEGYHDALTAYRQGDVNPIVAAFSRASFRAIENSRELIREIDEIKSGWKEKLTARRGSNAWRLLDVFARRPVLNAATAAQEIKVQQPNVYPPMQALVDAGIVTAKAEHGQGPFWRSDEILAAVDAFARRAGRRQAR